MRRQWVVVGLGVVLGLATVAGGCGDDESAGSTEDLTQQVCADASAFEGELDKFAATLSTPSVDFPEVQDSWRQVTAAWADLSTASADLAGADMSALTAAYEPLEDSVTDIGDLQTLQQALPSLTAEVANVRSAEQTYAAGLGCS